MHEQVEKVADRLGLFLGLTIFMFGFLKFFDPFHSWFASQITNSGLPTGSFFMGISGEIGVGLILLGSSFARQLSIQRRHAVAAAGCLGLIVLMCVATYVHLQPRVPAAVLPLGIKPPVIPLLFLALGVADFALHARLWLCRAPARRAAGS